MTIAKEKTFAIRTKLAGNSLGFFSNMVIGIGSTAPAYSLAATLGFMVLSTGTASVGVLLLAFLPMLFIAFSYAELNRVMPECGTTFTWAKMAFGSYIGWFAGWCLLISCVISMANLAQIAGMYTFSLLGFHSLAGSKIAVAAVGLAWTGLIAILCYRGIKLASRLQAVLLVIEVVALIVFSGLALWKVGTHHAFASSILPHINWLNPFSGGHSMMAVASSLVLAVFLFWGWESTLSVNEETESPSEKPSKAAISAVLMLLLLYLVSATALIAFGGKSWQSLPEASLENVFEYFSTPVMGSFGGKILVFTVLTSSLACIFTSIIFLARTVYSMAQVKALPKRFAKIHQTFRTPTSATVLATTVSAIFYVVIVLISENILSDTISSVGMTVAIYYALNGFASVKYFWPLRHILSWKKRLTGIILPCLGGVMLLIILLECIREYLDPSYGNSTISGIGSVGVIGLGSVMLGILVLILMRIFAPSYFITGKQR